MVFDHKTAQEKIVPEAASQPPAAGERPATEALASEQSSSALGLDVGTSRIVVARGVGSHARFESQLNAFVKIPYSKMTIGVLCKEQIPHAVKGDQIIVEGNESARFAGLLDAEMQRPMTCGVLDASHADSLQVIQELLMSILGHADAFSERKVTFTVPAPPLGAEGSLTFHQKTLTQIIQDLGYETSCINEGLAVVYSELENSNYTGIGVSCGGGLCNVCLSYLSVPVLSFSVPKAGDFIDANAANVTGERANRIRLTKEDSFHFNGYFPDKTHQVISVYYEEVIQTLVASLKQAFARTATLPKFDRPIPLVLSGGTALPPGFRDRFEKLLREQDFPITVSEIRVAKDPLHATAKGALVFALSDEYLRHPPRVIMTPRPKRAGTGILLLPRGPEVMMSVHPPEYADTDPRAMRVWIEAQRRIAPGDKLAAVLDGAQFVLQLYEMGVRRQHPAASEREILLRVAARHLPRHLMIQAYGWDPESDADPV